jgi:hypothetical protein
VLVFCAKSVLPDLVDLSSVGTGVSVSGKIAPVLILLETNKQAEREELVEVTVNENWDQNLAVPRNISLDFSQQHGD